MFNMETQLWGILTPIGDIPAARYAHGACTARLAMFICKSNDFNSLVNMLVCHRTSHNLKPLFSYLLAFANIRHTAY